MLGKAIPVLSIAVDVTSIVTTWTSSNETLEKITKLKNNLLANLEAFRQAVRTYQKSLEDQIGDVALQKSLAKLLRLRKPPGPPMSPEESCKILGLMQGMIGIDFLVFATLLRGDHEDKAENGTNNKTEVKIEDKMQKRLEDKTEYETGNRYAAEFITRADVLELSQRPMCAPVVDSVYERYSDFKSSEAEKVSRMYCHIARSEFDSSQKYEPLQSLIPPVGSLYFRSQCSLVEFSGKRVYNASGTQRDKRASPWIWFWLYFMDQNARGRCSSGCKINLEGGEYSPDSHSWRPYVSRGGHMELKNSCTWQYIIPLCPSHNKKNFYDRGGKWMLTQQNTRAVRIPPA